VKGKGLQRTVGAFFALLLALGLGVSMLSGEPSGRSKSVGSTEPDGRRAALQSLRELGFKVEPWVQAPVFLPDGEALLWMADVPVLGSGDGESDQASAIAADPRHPVNYGEFVRAGGSLLLPFDQAHLEWLREQCGLEVPDWTGASLGDALDIVFDTGEEMRLSLEEPVHEASEAWDGAQHERLGWHDLALDGAGRPFASWAPVAYGRVAFLASDAFVDNSRLGEFENGLFLVRLVEALSGTGEVLFDEFALGLWAPESQVALLTGPGMLEILLHLFAALCLFVLLHTWVREFPRDREPPALHPRLRVQAQAAFLLRAQRLDLLELDLQLGVLLRVCGRLGIRAPRTERPAVARLRDLVAELGQRAPAGLNTQEWRAHFIPGRVQKPADLEQLGRELHAFEQRVHSLSSQTIPATRPS
jgi:hypothetical protein